MATKKKKKTYSKRARKKAQFTEIFGLKVAKATFTRALKGSYKNAAKVLADQILKDKNNIKKIRKVVAKPRKFIEQALQITNDDPIAFFDYITRELNKKAYAPKEQLIIYNLPDIILSSMTTQDELNDFLKFVHVRSVFGGFNDWTWNDTLKRFESPDGKYFIKIHTVRNRDYDDSTIEYGRT